MLGILRRGDKANGQLGYYRSGDECAFAHVVSRAAGDGRPILDYCSAVPVGDAGAFAAAARRLPGRRHRAVSVLPQREYSIMLVEAPNVPRDELQAAVRWRIKDLLEFPIDDAVIDVFHMPQRGSGGPNQMMYAVAARAERVRGEVDDAESAGLNLHAIDVLDLALRNVAALVEVDGEGVALLHVGQRTSTLLLVRQQVLYLTRRIETGAESFADGGGLRSELVDGLALEIRRSLDYFESHYEQSRIGAVYTCGLETWDLDQLTASLGISVRQLDVTTCLGGDLTLSPEEQRRCLPAIGAALRSREAAA